MLPAFLPQATEAAPTQSPSEKTGRKTNVRTRKIGVVRRSDPEFEDLLKQGVLNFRPQFHRTQLKKFSALLFWHEWNNKFHPNYQRFVCMSMCAALFRLPETTFGRYVQKLSDQFYSSPSDVCLNGFQLSQRGFALAAKQRIFSDQEEDFIAEVVRQAYWSGFGLCRDEFLALVGQMAKSCGDSRFQSSIGFYRSFRKRHPDLRPRKTSALDRKRAAKATPETRDAMFANLGEMASRLFQDGLSPFEKIEDWPAHLKFSYDEGFSSQKQNFCLNSLI